MASPTELSSTPDNNISIGGYNVAEGCPAANLNNALRYLAAIVRVTYDGIPSTSSYVTATGATFLNQPIYQGRGALLYHADPANVSGVLRIVPDGTTPAGLANGDLVIGI